MFVGGVCSEFEKKTLEKLDEIVERLNILVDLSVPPLNIEGLKLGEVERQILELCDLKNTREDMASKLGKNLKHIDKTLTGLRNKGLIRSLKIAGKTCYIRLKR